MAIGTQADATDRVIPTLLIGLGGTGAEVLMRVRRLFFERYGANPDGSVGYPFVGYLAIDTNNEAFTKIQNADLSEYVRRNIQLRVGGDPPEAINCLVDERAYNEYLTGGERDHPHIFSWLERPVLTRVGAVRLTGGAGQCRPLGRLAFFHHFDRIRDAVQRRIEEIQRNSQPAAAQPWLKYNVQVDPTRLHVVVIYSLAGGTGAGMFLDTGMLVRKVVTEDLKLTGVQVYYTHFAVLPEIFLRGVQLGAPHMRSAIQENAYGALREMEYFSMSRVEAFGLSIPPPAGEAARSAEAEPYYRVQWTRGERPYDVHTAPWDLCYLVGSENDAVLGDRLPVEDVFQMLADHLFIDFDPSELGRHKRAQLPNLSQQTHTAMEDEVRDQDGVPVYRRYLSRRFSTFGLSKIYFDRVRMRRAAGYRLALRLVREWWLRPSRLTPSGLVEEADRDLGNPTGAQGDVTQTHLPGEGELLPLSLDVLADRVARGEAGHTDWTARLADEARQLLDQLQEIPAGTGGDDPAGLIEAYQRRHLEQLRRSEGGVAGVVIQEFTTRRTRLEDWARSRVDRLFSFQLDRHGVEGVRDLLRRYAELLRERVEKATALLNRPPTQRVPWQDRLRDARRVPLRRLFPSFSRSATRAETERSVRVVTRHLDATYRYQAAAEARTVLDTARRLLTDDDPSSYVVMLDRFRRTLQTAEIEGFFQEEFETLNGRRAPDHGAQRSAPLGAVGRRSHGLFDRIDPKDYDRHISLALKPAGLTDADGVLDWPGVERAVLEQLRKAGRPRWRGVERLGDLVVQILRLDAAPTGGLPAAPLTGPAPAHSAAELASDLAEACEELLARFVTGTDALQVFFNGQPDPADRNAILDQFCRFSSPYLRRNPTIASAKQLHTPANVCLGLPAAGSDLGRKFLQELVATPSAPQLDTQNPAVFQVKDDELMLYQDRHGVPVAYYQGLDQLATLYDRSNRLEEAHLDYNALVKTHRLPDIRLVDQSQHKHLTSCIEMAIVGTTTGRLPHDRRSFKVVVPQAGGAPLMFSVGGGIDQVSQFYARPENAQARDALARAVDTWFHENAPREEGLFPALVWASLQFLYEELLQRVQAQIDRDRMAEKRPSGQTHPLLSVLANVMLPEAERRVRQSPRGDEWIHALSWEGINAPYFTGARRDEARARWWQKFAACFEPVPDEMPIPVIRHDARLQPGMLHDAPARTVSPSSDGGVRSAATPDWQDFGR